MGHKNPDIDCLGSAIGIFKVCQVLQKPAHIVINEVTTNISKLYERLINLEEYKKEVFINNQEAEKLIDSRTLLVVVDVHKLTFVESKEVLFKSKKTVIFDHHRKSTESIEDAVLSYIEPYASSTSELVTELLQYVNEKVKLKPVEADALLGGITVDTKNFTVKTGARTFEAAAFLKRNGADSVRVHTLFQNKLKDYTARVNAVKDAEIFEENIAIAICTSDLENPSLIVAQAADELLSIVGIKSSFVMCKKGDGVSISARSLGDINVQLVMEKLGGGGHQTVSGAQIENVSLEEAKGKIKQAILEYLREE
jgi:c-di-AMP phosphodiesterase-like protein